jgi:hypothetical protein
MMNGRKNMDQQMYHDQVMMEKQMMEVNKYIMEGSKMGVYKKLMQARLELQETNLTKSGHNKFAGYKYFELGDFLPAIQKIFARLNICGIVSFGQELATLTITDLEDGSQTQITSPMSTAALKGCHEVQNLGAVQTYIRRYLWVAALEIVEHDVVDASAGAATFKMKDTKAEDFI